MASSRRPTRYRVLWTGVAEEDVAAIADYASREAPAAALSLLDRLERRASSLERFPLRGRVVPELTAVGVSQFREVIEPPFRLVYEVNTDMRTVYVFAVIDGRRDVRDILLRRVGGG